MGRQKQGRLALGSDPHLPLSKELYEVSLDNDSDSLEPAGGRVHHNPTAQQMAHGFVSCKTASNTDPRAAVPPRHAFTELWVKERVNITIS